VCPDKTQGTDTRAGAVINEFVGKLRREGREGRGGGGESQGTEEESFEKGTGGGALSVLKITSRGFKKGGWNRGGGSSMI